MYPISSAVKALFDAEQRQVLRITGTDKNGASISITDADVLFDGFSIDRYCCNGEKLEVGTAIAGQMTLKLNNTDGRFSDIVFEGAELYTEVGIADWSQSSPTVNWIPCGRFTPDTQPRKLNNINLTCLDRMTKFDATVDRTALTLPATVAGLITQVRTVCGVPSTYSNLGKPNATVMITALPSGDITYRDLIQWLAGIMGTCAWIDWNGELRFNWFDGSTGYAMTTANRFDSDLYENDLSITGAMYTNASGVEIVEGTDDYAIDLTGNALAGPIISTVLSAINTAINGFTYRPFTATVINAPYLWPLDLVTFTDKDGNDHVSALTNVAFGLNGCTALESKGLTYAINQRAQPKGVTKEQAQLITEAMEQVETDIDESLTQQDIFNRLTDNGAAQGLFLTQDGQLYVNASYIYSGTLTLGGLNNQNGTMVVNDASGNTVGSMTKDGIVINAGSIISYSADKSYRSLLDVGLLSAEGYLPSQSSSIVEWRRLFALRNTLGTTPETSTTLLQGEGNVYIQPGETNSVTISGGYIVATNKFYTINVSSVSGIQVTGPFKVNLGSGDADELGIASDGAVSIGRPANWRSAIGIKWTTVTGTTGSTGVIGLGLAKNRYMVTSVWSLVSSGSSHICTPLVTSGGTNWSALVETISHTAVANTAVTLYVGYIDFGAGNIS